MKLLSLLLITLFILTGCSQKQYFEPEETDGDYEQSTINMPADIIDFNRSGATLSNGQVVTKEKFSSFKLPEGYSFINSSENGVIASDNKSKIIIGNKANEIEVGGIIVAATLKDSTLAMIYSDNAFVLYDINTKKYLLKEYLNESLANDTRITNPIFMKNLVLFPTLDGKIKVVGLRENKIVKTITVDAQSTFNNIIYLDVINDTLVAATSSKIITVSTQNVNTASYEVRDIITNKDSIYVATVDGELIKLDFSLTVLAKKKFKFARFYALAFGTSLYALESQGFMIKVSEDFKDSKILEFSFNEDEKAIGIKNRLYFGDEYTEVK
jgi:hypothetical protein